MKRFLAMVIGIILMVTSFGCTKSNEVDNDEQNEISIIISEREYKYNKHISSYAEKIEEKMDIKINFDIIQANTTDDYIKKLNTKLYLENGPTLIYIPKLFSYQKYVEQGVALDVTEKIPNLEKVYDSLLTDKVYFVPIAMRYSAIVLDKKILDELDIEEPKLDWTKEEYLKMKEKWLEQEIRYFTHQEYNELVKDPLYDIVTFDKNRGVKLNTNDVKEYIEKAREEIFSGKYLLDNSYYSFEDYYNIFIEGHGTEEFSKAWRFEINNENKRLIKHVDTEPLYTEFNSVKIGTNEVILLPEVREYNKKLYVDGFLINRNGKNVDLGIKFLNEILDDEIQMIVYNDLRSGVEGYGGTYPVNKEIEDEIDKKEKENNMNEKLNRKIHKKAIELRKYTLKQIKDGEIKLYKQNDAQNQEFYKMLRKDTFKFIFTKEPYSDEEISRELEKLENKYNIWLNE